MPRDLLYPMMLVGAAALILSVPVIYRIKFLYGGAVPRRHLAEAAAGGTLFLGSMGLLIIHSLEDTLVVLGGALTMLLAFLTVAFALNGSFRRTVIGILSRVFQSPRKRRALKQEQWDGLVNEYERINQNLTVYDSDPDLFLRYPLMHDFTSPEMMELALASKQARDLYSGTIPRKTKRVEKSPFARAVADYREAFEKAERMARSVNDSDLTDKNRKSLSVARKMVAIVNDERAFEGERQNAYHQVVKSLNGFMPVPEQIKITLERRAGITG